MPASSDIQQSRDPQLKRAFHQHLPRRLASVQRRLRALGEAGWDINTLALIYSEIQQLAGSSGKYGMVEVSEKLFALETYLAPFVDSGEIPDADQTDEIHRLITQLDAFTGGSDPDEMEFDPQAVVAKVIATASPAAPVLDDAGVPLAENVPTYVEPPAEFLPFEVQAVRPFHNLAADEPLDTGAAAAGYGDPEIERLSAGNVELTLGNIAEHIVTGDEQLSIEAAEDVGESWRDDVIAAEEEAAEAEEEVEPGAPAANAAAPPAPEAPPRAEPAAPAPQRQPTLYYLHLDNEHTRRLAASLEGDYDLHSFDDVEEFKEVISAMGPEAVLIDGVFIDEIENLGTLVKRIRQKQNRPMPMLAFSDSTDVGHRLKILRAGADAFLKSSAEPAEVRRRLAELMHDAGEDPYRVLIVEDDRAQGLFAESILRKVGMDVRLERDPMKVMDQLERFDPELILMDLYMPQCDGMELTAIIRERDDFINTPIVFLSGEVDTDKHFDALLAGGDDFLSKPIRPRHLIQAVTNRVQRARAVARRQRTAPGAPDSVTGLTDRPRLLEQTNRLLAEIEAGDPKRPGGILYVEIDRPFELRKRLGLTGFEQLSEQIGPLLTEALGADDLATRYSDNAYCLMLERRSVEGLRAVAQQCVQAVGKHFFRVGDGTAAATVSVGVCQLSSQLADAGAVIAAAERACNTGGGAGRIGVQELAGDIFDSSDEVLPLLIEDALKHDRLQVVFQPIVSLRGDAEEQYQALVRIVGEDDKPIPAASFIAVAEQTGMVEQIDRWILKRALSVIDERRRAARPLRLFVNQSQTALTDKELLTKLYKQLQTRGVDPSYLVLEFKLPEIINRLKAAVALATGLKKLGVKMSLGGFDGSDPAFQALEHLAVDFVKLPAADPESGDGVIGKDLGSVVERLHRLEKLVIIPAIEDAKTAARLWSTGVDFIQGNFVQRPEAELIYQFTDAHA